MTGRDIKGTWGNLGRHKWIASDGSEMVPTTVETINNLTYTQVHFDFQGFRARSIPCLWNESERTENLRLIRFLLLDAVPLMEFRLYSQFPSYIMLRFKNRCLKRTACMAKLTFWDEGRIYECIWWWFYSLCWSQGWLIRPFAKPQIFKFLSFVEKARVVNWTPPRSAETRHYAHLIVSFFKPGCRSLHDTARSLGVVVPLSGKSSKS
jgi:hypothetical protein